jgi:UDP-N-acetyl-D-mannosaminuronic acid transferase (WecB/TagA/CpsF family)
MNGGTKQEMWLTEQAPNLTNSVIVGADDAFRVIAGRQQMPPIWVQQKEWTGVYRILRNPFNFARIFRIFIIVIVSIYRKIFRRKT